MSRQSLFQVTANEEELLERLADLRREVQDAKLDWYVVPSEDEHQSEDVGESEKRRQYITGFTGSAGTALIPASSSSKALLFVDSRYWIQAEQQTPVQGWSVFRVGADGKPGGAASAAGWTSWVVKEAADGARIGIDSKLISQSLARFVITQLEDRGSTTTLVPLTANLIDRMHTPPARSLGPLIPHPVSFSGESTPSKLSKLRDALSSRAADSVEWIYLLPTLPAIAWLLNYRCPSDIPFCPVAYAYLALTNERCVIFVDEEKVGEELRTAWAAEEVEIQPYGVDAVGSFVAKVAKASKEKKKRVKVWAPASCSWALAKAAEPTATEIIACPVEVAKAIKNPVEQQGFRNAYLRDGRAMIRWMAWLEQTILSEKRQVGEWAAAQTLTRYRRQEEHFAGLAYEDISASGPNGALPHYAPQRGQDRPIDVDATYVIDSGAQYLDGTIDTTRTMYLGSAPSPEVKRAFTRVLQSHLAVSTAVFPEGMSADWLNMLAKQPLYLDRLDFGHGLGHGVGSYLAVHEYPSSYPHGISFQPGHVTTIEPGYYREGEWGIRTESLLLCKELKAEDEPGKEPDKEPDEPEKGAGVRRAGGQKWLGFDRITQVPIQTSLVEWSLLSKAEIRWLNEHNTSVQDALMPLLQEDRDAQTRDWLKKACKPRRIWPWSGRR